MASTTIKQKVMGALDKIGRTNGHNVPESQDPSVPLQHEYYVATLGEAYFKKRRDKAKTALEKSINDIGKKKLDKAIAGVKENEVADTCTLIESDPFITSVDIKNGASYLDPALLKVTLMREHKMNATQVEALFEKCTGRREPAKSWQVVER